MKTDARREYEKAWRAANKDHLKEYFREYHERNRDKKIRAAAVWRRSNPEATRIHQKTARKRHALARLDWMRERRKDPAFSHNHHLRRTYGITRAVYDEMLASQNGVCKICLREETRMQRGKIVKMAVDHCHDTGKVRGLLCNLCNQGLGFFADNVERMEAAIAYLRAANG